MIASNCAPCATLGLLLLILTALAHYQTALGTTPQPPAWAPALAFSLTLLLPLLIR